MSAYRDSLPGGEMVTKEEAFTAAARIWAEGRARRDSLTPEQAAREAYVPGGPSVEEIAELIRQQRARARAKQAAKATERAA